MVRSVDTIQSYHEGFWSATCNVRRNDYTFDAYDDYSIAVHMQESQSVNIVAVESDCVHANDLLSHRKLGTVVLVLICSKLTGGTSFPTITKNEIYKPWIYCKGSQLYIFIKDLQEIGLKQKTAIYLYMWPHLCSTSFMTFLAFPHICLGVTATNGWQILVLHFG